MQPPAITSVTPPALAPDLASDMGTPACHIALVAHAPLASAMRAAVLHVFPEAADGISAYDVAAQDSREQSLQQLHGLLALQGANSVLVLADVWGASPCNIACDLAQGKINTAKVQVLSGMNLPMVIKAWTYRQQALAELVLKVAQGGQEAIRPILPPAQSAAPPSSTPQLTPPSMPPKAE